MRLGRAAAAAGSGALAARHGLRRGHHRRRRRRRPHVSDGRSFQPAASASSSCDSARRPARSSSRPNGWRSTCSTRSRAPPGRTTSRSRWAMSASSRRRIRSTRSSCGPADRTKACCRWRSGRRRAFASTDFEETLRRRFSERFPTAQFSFEPGDIVNRIMNFGTSTPVEVAVTGPDFAASRTFAAKVRDELARIPALRDLQYGQALDYPAIQVDVNRQMAGQLGVTVDQIGRSFAASTSSSRFVAPNYWADPRTGIAFQVQIEVPQPQVTTLDDLRVVPVSGDRGAHALLGDVATINNATIVGEYDRINGQRMVTLTANVAGQDLGRTVGQVDAAIARAGAPPRGARGRGPRPDWRRCARRSRTSPPDSSWRSSSSSCCWPPTFSRCAWRSSSSRPCRPCSWAWC